MSKTHFDLVAAQKSSTLMPTIMTMNSKVENQMWIGMYRTTYAPLAACLNWEWALVIALPAVRKGARHRR